MLAMPACVAKVRTRPTRDQPVRIGEAVRTDDVDAAFERVRAFGAEVLQEPIDQPWGPRDCAFWDPSGTMVRISQAPKA